jgi:hypothetical protein
MLQMLDWNKKNNHNGTQNFDTWYITIILGIFLKS